VFIIDLNKKLRLTITYPASSGQNFYVILRVIDSFELTAHHQVATPMVKKK
jgi:GTP-binding protein HflX